jgi:hypothetical protein
MTGFWHKQKPDPLHPGEQTYELDCCEASVAMGATISPTDVVEQLRHANQQLELQRKYPGRHREPEPTNVIPLDHR